MEERREPAGFPEPTGSSWEQYLTFELGEELYGLEILKIQEIIRKLEITPVPRMPKCLLGVVNLRGKIIPILSLRRVFDMEEEEHGSRTSIIVTQLPVEGELVTLGLLVDEASEVVRVPVAGIEKPSLFSGSRVFDFIEGIARVDGRIVCLLKLERLLTEVEQTAVRTALEAEPAAEDGPPENEPEPQEVSS